MGDFCEIIIKQNKNMHHNLPPNQRSSKDLAAGFNLFSNLSIVIVVALALVLLLGGVNSLVHYPVEPIVVSRTTSSSPYQPQQSSPVFKNLWKAPDINTVQGKEKEQLLYGKELIANTSIYLGPKGSVKQLSNGLNCQNCHLAAGTQPFGNNYASVAATYPQIRARSGTIVDVKGRINACFQRSLNGDPLALNSKEMLAMEAYINWLGKDVAKGQTPEGAGMAKLPYLTRAADPQKGKLIYEKQCEQCHGKNGEGILNSAGNNYVYPPLWGEHSYNVSAGLYRIEKFARFVKNNMPFGVSYQDALLTDEQAWDIAAYVNSQPHPNKKFPKDWMTNLVEKPIDTPFGPYADHFTEEQHKYGPYEPIQQAIKALKQELN